MLNAATHVTVADLIELQRHAGKIDLTHARSARASLAGNHLSRFRGRGMDYQESRAYQAGDDVRSMDWRVTARTGKPHVKLYQEERERPVVLFLDLNPGMFFGSRGMLKSVVAARAAALIAWAAAAHGDRVGAMLFNGGYCDLQPRGGKHGVLRLIRQVVEHTDPRTGVDAQTRSGGLNAALSRLRRVSRPGSLIVLLGDYYGIDDDSGKHLLHLRQHSDVVGDPDRRSAGRGAAGRRALWRRGRRRAGHPRYPLDGRATGVRGLFPSPSPDGRSRSCAACAIPLLRLSTGDDVAAALRRHFAARRRASRAREGLAA